MKFSEYYEENIEIKKDDWVKKYDFATCHLISEARLKAGLTQKELADLVGTQQPSIARAENGSVLPGHSLLKKIALAIGAPLSPPKFNFMENIKTTEFAYSSYGSQAPVTLEEYNKLSKWDACMMSYHTSFTNNLETATSKEKSDESIKTPQLTNV